MPPIIAVPVLLVPPSIQNQIEAIELIGILRCTKTGHIDLPQFTENHAGRSHAATVRNAVTRRGLARSDVVIVGVNWKDDQGEDDDPEGFFNRIKQCPRIATRYDKVAANYLAFIKLASVGN